TCYDPANRVSDVRETPTGRTTSGASRTTNLCGLLPSAAGILGRIRTGVDIQPLAEMLEDLLREASEAGGEVYLAETSLEPTADHEALHTEYEHRHQRAVAAVCEARGPAQFEGPGAEAGLAVVCHCE